MNLVNIMTNIYPFYAMDFVSGNCSSGPCRNSFSSKFGWRKLGRPSVLVPWCWRGKSLQFEHHIPYIQEFNSFTTKNKSEIFSNWTLCYHFELFPNSQLVNHLCPYRWLVLFVLAGRHWNSGTHCTRNIKTGTFFCLVFHSDV